MKYFLFYIATAMMIFSCKSQFNEADLIVHNARVYTVDENFSVQQAFAVKEAKFVAVGSNADIIKQYYSDNIIDADGKTIYPGFIDAHCHFFGFGSNLLKQADLVGTTSFEEVISVIKEHHKKYPSQWIEGRGWDQNDWEIKEFPDNKLLDEVFPDIPVYLTRIDGHAAIVNSIALKIAGITEDTKAVGGNFIINNEKLTGVLIDNAMDLVRDLIPKPDKEFNQKALLLAQQKCFEVGLTSVTDAGLDIETVLLIDEMFSDGSLKIRINAMLTPTDNNFKYFVINGPYITDRLTVRSIKLYADGALGSRGAKLIEPYSDDPDNNGLLIEKPDFFRSVCKMAIKNGYQVNTHAIGDSANRMMLNIYGEFLKGKNDLRWRIEHAQVVSPNDFDLFGKYSVIPSVQPTHATSDMYWAEDRVGQERIKGAYANKQLLEENGWIPLGTDFPVESINPLYTFYAAVSRQDLNGWPAEGFQTENALTKEEALRGMTIWAAKAAFEEDKKGSIEPGKFADFVILEEDIIITEIDFVPRVKVIATFSGGEKVFE